MEEKLLCPIQLLSFFSTFDNFIDLIHTIVSSSSSQLIQRKCVKRKMHHVVRKYASYENFQLVHLWKADKEHFMHLVVLTMQKKQQQHSTPNVLSNINALLKISLHFKIKSRVM